MANDRVLRKLWSFRERYGVGEGSIGSLSKEEVNRVYEELRLRYPRLAMVFTLSLGRNDLLATNREALIAAIVLGRISRGTATEKDRDLLREAVQMPWADNIRDRVMSVLTNSKSDEAEQLVTLCDEMARRAEALLARQSRRPCRRR